MSHSMPTPPKKKKERCSCHENPIKEFIYIAGQRRHPSHVTHSLCDPACGGYSHTKEAIGVSQSATRIRSRGNCQLHVAQPSAQYPLSSFSYTVSDSRNLNRSKSNASSSSDLAREIATSQKRPVSDDPDDVPDAKRQKCPKDLASSVLGIQPSHWMRALARRQACHIYD
jgi:hypothetical protein